MRLFLLFGVNLSSVKRSVRIAQRRVSLVPRKGGGRPPKTDQTVQKPLEGYVKERPAAIVAERCRFLERTTGKILSTSTVKRLRFSRKTNSSCGGAGASRMAGDRLEGDTRPGDRYQASWCSWTKWGPTSPFTRFTPGHREAKGHTVPRHATAGPTLRFWRA